MTYDVVDLRAAELAAALLASLGRGLFLRVGLGGGDLAWRSMCALLGPRALHSLGHCADEPLLMTPDAEALLNYLAEHGVRLEALGPVLRIHVPEGMEITSDLDLAVRRHKDELLDALTVDVKSLDLVELGDVPLPEKRPTTPEATASTCGESRGRITPLGLTPADETVWEGEVRWR